jgi:hypothetical protein
MNGNRTTTWTSYFETQSPVATKSNTSAETFNQLYEKHRATQLDLMNRKADLDRNFTNNTYDNEIRRDNNTNTLDKDNAAFKNTLLQSNAAQSHQFNLERDAAQNTQTMGRMTHQTNEQMRLNTQTHGFDKDRDTWQHQFGMQRDTHQAEQTMRVNTQAHTQGMERDTHQTTEQMRLKKQSHEHDVDRMNVEQTQHLARQEDNRRAALSLYNR